MNKEKIIISAESPLMIKMSREGGQRERIGIRNEYPETDIANSIFQSLAVMYLVSPYLPKEITTDFYVPLVFQNLIRAMYEKEEYEGPKFILTDKRHINQKEPAFNMQNNVDNKHSVLTYSGGKDSMWNLDWLSRELGIENVLAVHLGHVNHVSGHQELKATTEQSQKIGFSLKVIDLLNSSKNSGKNVMRARDMFIVGTSIPLALKFEASQVYLEGGFNPEGTPKGEPFTTYEDAWKIFNDVFESMGIPVKASWRNSTGMNAVSDLIKNRPGWLPLVYNCFSPECYKTERTEKWKRVAPTFPLYDGQCGSCVKCRELNIARIIYDPTVQTADSKDIQEYIKDTSRWAKEHRNDLADILDGAFTEHLKAAALKYEV